MCRAPAMSPGIKYHRYFISALCIPVGMESLHVEKLAQINASK